MGRIQYEFATHDDCLDKMVPSHLRKLVAERDTAEDESTHLGGLLKKAEAEVTLSRRASKNVMAQWEKAGRTIAFMRGQERASNREVARLTEELEQKDTEIYVLHLGGAAGYKGRAEQAEATVARLTKVEAAAKEWRKHMDEPAHAALRRALSALGL